MGIGGPCRKTVCLACWQRAQKLGLSIVLNQGVEEKRACLSAWHRSHLFTAQALHLRVYVMYHQQEGVYVVGWGVAVGNWSHGCCLASTWLSLLERAALGWRDRQ